MHFLQTITDMKWNADACTLRKNRIFVRFFVCHEEVAALCSISTFGLPSFLKKNVRMLIVLHLHLSFNRKRIQGTTSRLDPVSEQIINELKNQNEDLQSRMSEMDIKMKQILDLVQDIHTKNNC